MVCVYHYFTVILNNVSKLQHIPYKDDSVNVQKDYKIHLYAHTHTSFTQTHSSDKKENMTGMKASREERRENTAVSQTFGLK